MSVAAPLSPAGQQEVVARPLKPGIVWLVSTSLVALACSFALWDPLEIDERRHIRRLTQHAARSVKADLLADLQARILAHVRLAETWAAEEDGEALGGAEWAANSAIFLEHHPANVALQWLDPELAVQWWKVRGKHDPDAVRIVSQPHLVSAARLTRGTSGQAVLTPAFSLRDGTSAAALVVPVSRARRFEGYLVAILDIRSTIDSLLLDHSDLGYLVTVLEDGRNIYVTPGTTAESDAEWVQELEVALPGTRWLIRVWPNPETLSDIRSPLPEIALVLGGLLGFLLMVTQHLMRAARATAEQLRRAHDLLEVRVHERTADLQNLSGRLLQLRDEEQRRIARELHDSTAQTLGAVAMNVDRAQQLAGKHDDDRLDAVLREVAEHIDSVTQEIRTVSYLLHPPILDDLGLEYVLRWYADGFSARSGIPVELIIPHDFGRLPQEIELTLFRIAQEALTNIHRHAGPCSARMTLSRDETVATLEIRDTGSGMPGVTLADATAVTFGVGLGVGLAGMRERVRQLGGELHVESSPHGTLLAVRVPTNV